MSRRVVIVAALSFYAGYAEAARIRHRFEPTDLELVDPGQLELDHQTGFSGAGLRGPQRFIISDFELNLGLRRNVELDIDGAWANVDTGGTRQWIGDALWASMKLGLADLHLRGEPNAIALGFQLGPRIPTLHTGNGVGYGALILAGITWGRSKFAVNAGYFIDPGTAISSGRPSAFLLGLDVSHPLGNAGEFALLSEGSAVGYTSSEPYQLDIGLGLEWDPNQHLGLSIMVGGGRLASAGNMHAMLGMAPSIDLW